MSFPRYPKYKDSGVEWLGPVPEHWGVKKLRFVVELNPSKSEADRVDRATAVSFLPMEAIGHDGSINLEIEKEIRAVETGYIYFRDGDVAFAKITPCYENGKGALMRGLVNGIGFGTTELIVARPRPTEITGEYLHYIFISPDFRTIGESHMYGAGGQKRVPDEFVRNFATAFPPLAEQTQIAEFLDRETGKIDALVAEQRRLMELLKEKRQAVISHAVTKGLNPKAPLKPSGIEWLGEVPEHWKVKPVKYVARIGNGSTPNRDNQSYWQDGNYPWLNSSVVNLDSVTEAEQFVTQSALKECHLPIVTPPAVLVGITGQGRTRGMATMLLIEATINQHVAYLKPIAQKVDVHFLRRVFDMAYTYLRRDSETGSTKGAITCEQLGNMQIAVPPPDEQEEIVSYTKVMSEEFDTLTAEAQRAIDLLQERRTALISAAVTGQIDVRKATA